MVHSCHHPVPHKIPLDEIENNPAALFNTKHLKKVRTQMLNDKKPEECDYCWRIEADGNTSDRIFKSLEDWAFNDHDEVTQLKGDEDIYPSYLEVSFSNTCNMKCTYCGPEFSSKWVEEIKQLGPINVLEGTDFKYTLHGHYDVNKMHFKNRDFNPYIDAFWKWFPSALLHLKTYRITGGEPLLSKETFKSMQWLIDNPNLDLEFSINSNLCVPNKLWDKFIDKIVDMNDSKCVRKITIFTSVEGWGEKANYARTGMDFNLFKDRVEQLVDMDNIRVVVMSAFNIFSITSFQKVLEWIHALKLKGNPNSNLALLERVTGFRADKNMDYASFEQTNPSHLALVGIDIPYLRFPKYLDAHFCTHELLEDYLLPTLSYMSDKTVNDQWNHPGGFESNEFEKLKRIVMHRVYYNKKSSPDRESGDDIRTGRAGFYDFVNTMDKRRNTNFLITFPEMADFYADCKRCKEELTND